MNDEFCTIRGRKDLIIRFNYDCPEEVLRDKCLVGLTNGELKEALDKPFVVENDLIVRIFYNNEFYSFIIPKGYDWNGANVPAGFWLIIGQQKEPRFKLASCVHDYICEHKGVINYSRYLSTLIFESLCEYYGRFNSFKRWAMFHSVDNWQKLQRGWRK